MFICGTVGKKTDKKLGAELQQLTHSLLGTLLPQSHPGRSCKCLVVVISAALPIAVTAVLNIRRRKRRREEVSLIVSLTTFHMSTAHLIL